MNISRPRSREMTRWLPSPAGSGRSAVEAPTPMLPKYEVSPIYPVASSPDVRPQRRSSGGLPSDDVPIATDFGTQPGFPAEFRADAEDRQHRHTIRQNLIYKL